MCGGPGGGGGGLKVVSEQMTCNHILSTISVRSLCLHHFTFISNGYKVLMFLQELHLVWIMISVDFTSSTVRFFNAAVPICLL